MCSERREAVLEQRALLLEGRGRGLLLAMECWKISLIVYNAVPILGRKDIV